MEDFSDDDIVKFIDKFEKEYNTSILGNFVDANLSINQNCKINN